MGKKKAMDLKSKRLGVGMKKVIVATAVGVAAGAYVGHEATKVQPVKKVEQVKPAATDKLGKRWVVYNPKTLFAKPDGKLMMAQSMGSVETMPHLNGVVMKEKPAALPKGWVAEEEKIYKTQFLTGCAPVPSPTPGPEPTPPPTVDNEMPWGAKRVNAAQAQAVTKGSDVVVCVTDTGSDQDHPDLQGVLVGGQSMVPGYDWQDDHGHGTHVAGTIAAQANGKDVVGVSQAKIYTVKVLDRQGSGMSSWIANGIVACVRVGAKVINMSLGGDSPDSLIRQATDYAVQNGVIVVAAAGNSGGSVGYPAANPGVYAVSAVDSNDRLANFSSRGSAIDYAAPGVNIPSLRLGGGVISMSGTSMASPHVAGVFALSLSKGRKIIAAKSIGLGPTQEGKGMVDAYESVK